MPKRDTNPINPAAAMKAIQVDAYLAYIEWPILLYHRLKELEQHLAVTASSPISDKPTAPPAPPKPSVPPASSISATKHDQRDLAAPGTAKKSVAAQLGATRLATARQPVGTEVSPKPSASHQPTRKVNSARKVAKSVPSIPVAKPSEAVVLVAATSSLEPASEPELDVEAAVLDFLNGFSAEGGES